MTEARSEIVEGTLHLALPRVLDMSSAAELRDTILEMTEPELTIRLDARSLEQLTTPGAQILLAVADFIERKRAKLTIVNPSEALVDGLNDLGLFPQLMSWNVE